MVPYSEIVGGVPTRCCITMSDERNLMILLGLGITGPMDRSMDTGLWSEQNPRLFSLYNPFGCYVCNVNNNKPIFYMKLLAHNYGFVERVFVFFLLLLISHLEQLPLVEGHQMKDLPPTTRNRSSERLPLTRFSV